LAWADPNKGGNLGARTTPGDRHTVALMASRILERTGNPVVVVPAEAVAT